MYTGSPFGGIPRNWKHKAGTISATSGLSSPFGGIPRNWKRSVLQHCPELLPVVPPSGGSLEIGNW